MVAPPWLQAAGGADQTLASEQAPDLPPRTDAPVHRGLRSRPIARRAPGGSGADPGESMISGLSAGHRRPGVALSSGGRQGGGEDPRPRQPTTLAATQNQRGRHGVTLLNGGANIGAGHTVTGEWNYERWHRHRRSNERRRSRHLHLVQQKTVRFDLVGTPGWGPDGQRCRGPSF
jgi:hypothetical protein